MDSSIAGGGIHSVEDYQSKEEWLMREIKFRAWDSRTKEMHTMPNSEPFLWLNTFSVWFRCLATCSRHDGITVMQFTGLKDKNGKEIYEWDVNKDGSWVEVYKGSCVTRTKHTMNLNPMWELFEISSHIYA